MKFLIAAFLFITSTAFATDVVVLEAKVVSALNVRLAQQVGHHNSDLVSRVAAGSVRARFFVVADNRHVNHLDLVRAVNDRNIRVVVRRGALRVANVNLNYGDNLVLCERVVVRNGFIVSRRNVTKFVVRGALVGNNARRVQRAVDACR